MPLAREAAPPFLGAGVRRAVSPAAYWGKRLVIFIVAAWTASLVVGFEGALLILTLVGFAAAVAGVRRPVLGLLGVTMLCSLDPLSRNYLLTGGIWRWNTFNYWLLVVMLISLPFLLHLRDIQSRLLQIFVLLLFLELAVSADWQSGIQHVLNIVTLFGLLVYFARCKWDQAVRHWIALVSGTLAGAGGLVFYLKQESLPEINPNSWSFFPLTAIFAIALAFSSGHVRRGRLLLGLLAGVNSVWVFLSGSRGSFLITLVCLVFIVVQLWRSGRTVPILAAAVLLAVAVASQFLSEEAFAVRKLDKMLDTRRSLTSRTSGRWDLALGGWYIFRDHPFGVGTGGFSDAWANLRYREGLSAFREGEQSQAHSGWIKTLTENGIPGILILTAFLLSFAIVGWRQRHLGLFLLGLLATVGLSLALLPDEFQGKALWFLAAAVMTVFRRAGASRRRPSLNGVAGGRWNSQDSLRQSALHSQ